jgi:hypothetical protein
MLIYWLLLQFLGGFTQARTGGVAFWAHVGGFLAGTIGVKLFIRPPRLPHRPSLGTAECPMALLVRGAAECSKHEMIPSLPQ